MQIYGEHPSGYSLHTKGGHTIFFVAGYDRKAPTEPNPTDAEGAELFKTMTVYSGTYKVD